MSAGAGSGPVPFADLEPDLAAVRAALDGEAVAAAAGVAGVRLAVRPLRPDRVRALAPGPSRRRRDRPRDRRALPRPVGARPSHATPRPGRLGRPSLERARPAGAASPRGDLAPERLAQLAVAGGNIRNIALGAASLAADAGEAIAMTHVERAVRTEYAKLEREPSEIELGGRA